LHWFARQREFSRRAQVDPLGRTEGRCEWPSLDTLVGVTLDEDWRQLDERTPRASLRGLTPCELDRIAPREEDQTCRARSYRHVHKEPERNACSPCSARDRRKLEREAIWCALEQHGLVNRTRGGLPVRALKPQGIT
jgi:hypothetical protein